MEIQQNKTCNKFIQERNQKFEALKTEILKRWFSN